LRKARDPLGFWVHVMLLILMVQWPVYGMIPMQIHIVMIGIALAMRERSKDSVKRFEPAPERLSIPSEVRA
jgi:hypothetical protein